MEGPDFDSMEKMHIPDDQRNQLRQILETVFDRLRTLSAAKINPVLWFREEYLHSAHVVTFTFVTRNENHGDIVASIYDEFGSPGQDGPVLIPFSNYQGSPLCAASLRLKPNEIVGLLQRAISDHFDAIDRGELIASH